MYCFERTFEFGSCCFYELSIKYLTESFTAHFGYTLLFELHRTFQFWCLISSILHNRAVLIAIEHFSAIKKFKRFFFVIHIYLILVFLNLNTSSVSLFIFAMYLSTFQSKNNEIFLISTFSCWSSYIIEGVTNSMKTIMRYHIQAGIDSHLRGRSSTGCRVTPGRTHANFRVPAKFTLLHFLHIRAPKVTKQNQAKYVTHAYR